MNSVREKEKKKSSLPLSRFSLTSYDDDVHCSVLPTR